MKHLWLFLAVTLMAASTTTTTAQRIAYVNVSEILDGTPEYKNAQLELNQLAERWKQEIAQEYGKIETMYSRYVAEQPLLSKEAQKQREEEILAKEKAAREMQKQKFGPEGALFKKRQELVKPIQDKVYKAIQDYATSRGFDVIFDSSNGASVLYINPTMDKTEDIKKKLGLK